MKLELDLTLEEYDLIKTSLDYTKRAFAEYDGYPSRVFNVQRVELVDRIVAKLRTAKDANTH